MLLPATISPTESGPHIGPTAAAPRPGWPAKTTLDYHKTLIELLLLVLAIPWLVKQLVKHPGTVSEQAAKHHLGKAA